MKLDLNPKQFNYLAAGIIIIAALIVYSNSFQVPLQFDDIYHITQKKSIRDLSNFAKITQWENVNSRPLPMFTLALNFRWGGVNTTGYHVLNLIFHIITGWIVYLLSLQILSLKNLKLGNRITDNKEVFALLAALLFVVHPIQTQAVTYIVQRITVMVALFYLAAIYQYIKGRVAQLESGDWKKGTPNFILTLLFFGLAMLSKQIAVTLPLALVLVEFFFIRDKEGKADKKYLQIFAGTVFAFILIGVLWYGIPRESKDISRSTYLFTSFKVMVKYLQLIILPVNQNLDYDIKPADSLFDWRVLGSLAILGGLIYLAVKLYKKNPLVSFGIAWFFITLLVEQSVIPIKDFIFEHRLYLPSYGLILSALAALFTYIPSKETVTGKIPRIALMVAALVVIYGFAAHARNKVWKSDLTLWTDAVKKSPGKARPLLWQGIAFTNQGRYQEAKSAMDKCIEVMPNFPMAYYNRGNVNKELQDYKASLEDYNKAVELDPKYMLAYFNRGVVEAKMGRYGDAIEDYNITLKDDPDNTNTLYNRGNAYRNLRKYPESNYTLAIFNRGLSKAGMGQHEEALKDFDMAIRQDQKNHLFYNGKGVSLYQLGRYAEAIANYDAAIRNSPNFGQAYYNRAFAKYLGLHDYQGGCEDWQQALNLNYNPAKSLLSQYCGVEQPARQQPQNQQKAPVRPPVKQNK